MQTAEMWLLLCDCFNWPDGVMVDVWCVLSTLGDTGRHWVTCDQSVTRSADPQLLVPQCTQSSRSAALALYSVDCCPPVLTGLEVIFNTKYQNWHNKYKSATASSALPSTGPHRSSLLVSATTIGGTYNYLFVIPGGAQQFNNLKGIVCWRVNSPGLDFSMFWVKLSLKWLLANLSAKFLLFKFSIFLGFQSNLILTLCKLRTEGAKPSILEQNFKKFKQVSVSKTNPSLWNIKCCLLGPKLC